MIRLYTCLLTKVDSIGVDGQTCTSDERDHCCHEGCQDVLLGETFCCQSSNIETVGGAAILH